MPYFSLIIPVYNVAPYIEKCLESILEQSFDDFEAIIINDGSTDNSEQIIRNKVGNDSRFVVINKSNGGLSSARNAGLSIAKGDYIWFIDSDDWIAPDALNFLSKQLQIEKTDLIGFSFNKFYEADQSVFQVKCNRDSGLIYVKEMIQDGYVIEVSACIYCFNRNFLDVNQISFLEHIKLHEDEFFISEVFSRAETVQFSAKSLYNYRIRPNSLMTSKKTMNKLESFVELIAFFEENRFKKSNLDKNYWDGRIYDILLQFYKIYFTLDESLQQRFLPDFQKLKRMKLHPANSDHRNVRILKFLHNKNFKLFKKLAGI